ncbi:GNAT family N-acetyltransferase [Halalkalirubrum salinum]|uniref:GNAT family N-acetyltransferase n=1 Tax=Halalkalirubrum salinum TaxID=2563889 RepID=UPI0010FB8205|nr:GNAT family N-acetyltransferase [Halalkalirubrum salinum]
MSRPVSIRPAAEDEAIDVIRLFEGALLTVDFDTLRDAIAHGAVFVAVRAERVVGAVSLDLDRDPAHVEAIAVHPSHRRDGIGSQLLAHAASRDGAITAAFDSELRPFYESIGFTIEPLPGAANTDGPANADDADDRLFGRLSRP